KQTRAVPEHLDRPYASLERRTAEPLQVGVKAGVHAAIGFKARDAVARVALHGRETTAHQNLAVSLNRHAHCECRKIERRWSEPRITAAVSVQTCYVGAR